MEMVLDVYKRPYNPDYPVVCLDERPGTILESEEEPLEMRPGRSHRQDFEYHCTDRYTLFMAVEPLGGHRIVDVFQQGTGREFARFLLQVHEHYADARRITIVLDNLSTHSLTNLWKILSPGQALEVSKRFEFVFTPVHGSWLNIAEVSLAILQQQCFRHRRFDKKSIVRREVQAWAKRRNAQQACIEWGFCVHKSRDTFKRHYEREFAA